LIKHLGPAETLSFCYEAGPTGYATYRWITSMGAHCTVVNEREEGGGKNRIVKMCKKIN